VGVSVFLAAALNIEKRPLVLDIPFGSMATMTARFGFVHCGDCLDFESGSEGS